MSANLSKRIADYAYRFWMKHQMTEWPSVRRTAKALGVSQKDIADANSGEDFCTSEYLCHPPQPFGDHSVEAMTPQVDDAWRQYYAQR